MFGIAATNGRTAVGRTTTYELHYRQFVFRFPAGGRDFYFLRCVQADSGVRPAFCSVGTTLKRPQHEADRTLLVVSALRMSEAIPQFLHVPIHHHGVRKDHSNSCS